MADTYSWSWMGWLNFIHHTYATNSLERAIWGLYAGDYNRFLIITMGMISGFVYNGSDDYRGVILTPA